MIGPRVMDDADPRQGRCKLEKPSSNNLVRLVTTRSHKVLHSVFKRLNKTEYNMEDGTSKGCG